MVLSFLRGPLPRAAALASALLPALLAAACAAAPAAPPADPADPTNPRAAVPELRHRSSFATYRPLGDDPPLAWTEANERVRRIGGWRAYAREAAQREAPASAASAAARGAP